MTPDVRIEPIAEEHVSGFHRALDVVARERRFLTLLEAPPIEETRAFVLSGMTRGNARFVAIADGEVVGWCDITRHFFPSHAHRGTLGMGLIPARRGQGIGGRLLRATLAQAWASALTRVELAVHHDNAAAIALYERYGFVREGVERQASVIDGVYRDAVKMAVIRHGDNPEEGDRAGI